VLEVLDVNEPAYNLYRSLGFVHFDSVTRQKLDFEKLSQIPLIELPDEYNLRKCDRSKKSNQARYDLDLKATPTDVQIFHPVDRRKYFKSLLLRMLRPIALRIIKSEFHDWLIHNGDVVVGHVSVSPSREKGSPHRIEMMIDPEHAQVLAEPLLSHCLHSLKQNTSNEGTILVEFRSSETIQLAASRKFGFVDIETMHMLGLKLKE
ncbi:MAG: hypothetical protein RTU63_05045, partial [Candidatus Thorarchaeota archaeon]